MWDKASLHKVQLPVTALTSLLAGVGAEVEVLGDADGGLQLGAVGPTREPLQLCSQSRTMNT